MESPKALILFIFQWRIVNLIPVSVFLWHFKRLLLGGLLELRCWPLASTVLVIPSLAQKKGLLTCSWLHFHLGNCILLTCNFPTQYSFGDGLPPWCWIAWLALYNGSGWHIALWMGDLQSQVQRFSSTSTKSNLGTGWRFVPNYLLNEYEYQSFKNVEKMTMKS